MKQGILKIANKNIVFLLSLLGFTLASNHSAAQYGAPSVYFKINGTVKTEKHEPIKNIGVVIKSNEFSIDTIYTDSNGIFKSYLEQDRYEKKYEIDFNFFDNDGELNGNYEQQEKTVFVKPEENINIEVILEEKKKK